MKKYKFLGLDGTTLAISVALLTACAAQTPIQNAAPPPPPAVEPPPATLKSGLDLAGFDRSIRPQDDLFRFAGGNWLRTTEIPSDRPTYGTFEMLEVRAEEDIHQLAEAASRKQFFAPGSDEQKIGDLYMSFMDTERLEQLGISALKPELARIDAIRSREDVARYMGYTQRIGISVPIGYYVEQDPRNSSAYIGAIYQSGLTLPDRDYYLKPDKKYQELRAGLEKYIQDMLKLAGAAHADSSAKHITALEKRFAEAHWTRVKNRDPVATYNKLTVTQAQKLTPSFKWAAFFEGAGAPAGDIDINQPSCLEAVGKMMKDVPVAQWRDYFRFKLIDAYAPYLSQAFVDQSFDFRQRQLRGLQEQKPRWRRAVLTLNEEIGQLVGKLYVEAHFSADSKQRVRAIVDNLLKVYDSSLDSLDWMTPATRIEAKQKLASFGVKVGYPDQWRDYSKLQISRTDLVGNVMRAETFEHDRQIARLGGPVDRTEWLMAPQRVNAYYESSMNEIVFPAAILQPPFFDPSADDAVNYGGIAAVIGHEVSHGFDDSGSQFDGAGNLRNWWAPEDATRFKDKVTRLSAQYSAFTVLDGLHVNGDLTLGENIGDLSGLTVAYKAYMLSLNGKAAPVIDGFTGPQRFFLGWAQIWRRKYRDEELRLRIVTDPHSPGEFRANGVVANLTEFQQAFDVKPGDRLYRAADERVRIW
jgi:predicted metalloendopeptidase